MEEVWKDINGFEDYEVSNLGQVRNKSFTYKFLKNRIVGESKYYQVSMRKGKVTNGRYVHMLVADAFIPNPEGLKSILHLDGDKLNNKVDNLEWFGKVKQDRKGRRMGGLNRKTKILNLIKDGRFPDDEGMIDIFMKKKLLKLPSHYPEFFPVGYYHNKQTNDN